LDEDVASGLGDLPPGLAELVNQAQERDLLSFNHPKLVTRVVTHVRSAGESEPGGHFRNSSLVLPAGYQVHFSGQLAPGADEAWRLSSQIELAVIDQEAKTETRSEIQADILARLDHPVLVSFSTVGNTNSAIIVQLSAGDP
jgi:hypothetical protein